jgi:hypothetical protein
MVSAVEARMFQVTVEDIPTARTIQRRLSGRHPFGMEWSIMRESKQRVRSSGRPPRFALRALGFDPDNLPLIPSGCVCCDSPGEVESDGKP